MVYKISFDQNINNRIFPKNYICIDRYRTDIRNYREASLLKKPQDITKLDRGGLGDHGVIPQGHGNDWEHSYSEIWAQ